VRAAVALGRACDNACVFCAQEGLVRDAASDDGVTSALRSAFDAGADAVTFVGGEPVIDARLEAFVAKARALGFASVGVQTNGVALADEGRVEALAGAGLTDVHLSIHGAEARVHDWHTAKAGSFDAAVRAMARARGAGLDVVVATVLTRSNFRVLSGLPRLLASRGVAAWCIDAPLWRGRAVADRVVPRLALALPFALHALDAATKLGLAAYVRGAPACLVGPFAARSIDARAEEQRAFADACAACPARAACCGVDAAYLARFGPGELAPCAPTPRAVDAGRAAHAREMFVGPGELAPAPASDLPPPPERARIALPLLGRPAPARAEVSAGAPKQSGEALRAILPGLFPTAKGDDGARGA
jgi:hypothetical protein